MIQEEKKVGDEEKGSHQIDSGSHAHHSGVLRRVLERAVANRFSSKPIDMEKNRLEAQRQKELQQKQAELSILAADDDSKVHNSIRDVASYTIDEDDPIPAAHHHQQHYPTLTPSEQAYLEALLESEDPESIRQATLILSDRSLFPREDEAKNNDDKVEETTLSRRDSEVQRLFFRMHEMGRGGGNSRAKAFASSPIHGNSVCAAKRRLTWNERKEGLTMLESQTSMSSLLDVRSSILLDSERASCINNSIEADDMTDFENDILAEDDDFPPVPANRSGSSTKSQNISSWLYNGANNGSGEEKQQQGIEVDNDAGVMNSAQMAAECVFKTSFAILGTAADDASCHPHVLSPPLMESLLEFVPETLSDYHFWIKYSMVRDGANLYTLLRHVRASTRTIVAIETVDGQVFGAFTSHAWKLVQNLTSSEKEGNDNPVGTDELFYGSNDTFLWKMRQSRFESQALVKSATVEQAILMESELAVYPFTGSNNFVQHCSLEDGIGLGENAAAIRLDPSLRTGSAAPSETFGNPCLLDPKEEKSLNFQVANVEVWALTPNDNVKDAEQLELTSFFQQQKQEERHKRLDLFGILVGGPKRK